MEVVTYETVKEKIDNYYKNKVSVELYINVQEEKEKILSKLFKYEDLEKILGLFKVIDLDDITILEYEVIDAPKNKTSKNIVITKENKPVFKVEHYQPTECSFYLKDIFYTYDENGYLKNRLYIESILDIVTVKLANKLSNKREYSEKKYTFYTNNNDVVSLKLSDEIYFIGGNGFDSRVDTALSLINKTSNKINDKLDEVLGYEVVKEYQILRKRQEP